MNEIEKYFNKIPKFFENRGLHSTQFIKDFIEPPNSWLNNPYEFDSMDTAVDAILSNPRKNPIFIHGDCDADGVSSTALLYKYLKKIGFQVYYYIPNRSKEGHLISKKAIDYAISIGSELMITCDIGMSSLEEIQYAHENGLNTIITDHHKALDVIPSALVIINPWLEENSNISFREYSGSAVAFKLCHAINISLKLELDYLHELMALASIGIIADKVPIINENRYISYYGLKMIIKGKNKGISAISKNLFPYLAEIDISKIVRVINMTTKLDDPTISVKLLTSNQPPQINLYTNMIVKSFRKNQIIFNEIIHSSIRKVYSQDYKKNKSIFILLDSDSAYNGAVANTLSNKFDSPCIVLSKMSEGELYKGSCRSVHDINLFSFIESKQSILFALGGHPMAAGFTIEQQNIEELKSSFFSYMTAKNASIKKHKISRVLDASLKLSDIDIKFIEFIKQFKPYGTRNSIPTFISKDIKVVGKPIIFGKSKDSIKFKVSQDGTVFNSVGVGLINEFEKLVTENKLNIEYTISNNKNDILLNILGVS